MPLPKILTPTYELELTNKEENQISSLSRKRRETLWFSMESEDTKQITNTIKNVLKSCILTRGVKVEVLPTFDIEFLFLNIRAKSVGEIVELKLICPDDRITEVDVLNLISKRFVFRNKRVTTKQSSLMTI